MNTERCLADLTNHYSKPLVVLFQFFYFVHMIFAKKKQPKMYITLRVLTSLLLCLEARYLR